MPKKAESGAKISTLGSKQDEEFIVTGIEELDSLLGGGMPRARIVEFWGSPSVGKTHLATQILANASKKHKVLYCDTEYALNKKRVIELGADPNNISYVAESALEKVCELIVTEVGKNKWDYIILDSLAQLTPVAVANSEVGERSIGLFALLIKHWILKLRPLLAESKTAFLVLNQYRPPIGLYAVESPPGGLAFQHATDIRIKLSRNNSSDLIKTSEGLVGHYVHLEVKKNRLGPPGLSTKIAIIY